MKFIVIIGSFLMLLLSAQAAILKSVGKGKGIISFSTDENIQVGKTYFLLDFSGHAIGKVKIKKISKNSAIVLISKSAKGQAQVGFKVDTRPDKMPQKNIVKKHEKADSWERKTEHQNYSSTFSLFSEGKITGILGAKMRYALDPNSFLVGEIGKIGIKNDTENIQEGFQLLFGYGVPLNGNVFESGFYVEGHIGYVSTILSFVDHLNIEYEASLAGTIFGGYAGYHLPFDSFFIDGGVTINYYMLDSEIPVDSGHVENSAISGFNLLLHLGAGLHF